MRQMTDACDSDVQKDDPWSSHKPSTLKGTRTQTVQETAEVAQRLQLDRVVDVAVGTQRQTTDDPTFR